MMKLAMSIFAVLMLLGGSAATNPSVNVKPSSSNHVSSKKPIKLHGKGSLVEAHQKVHAHHKLHTGYQVRVANRMIEKETELPSNRVAARNSNKELLQIVDGNAQMLLILCITFMGGTLMAVLIAWCLWGGEKPPNKGLPPLHGRGGFPYMAAFPKAEAKNPTIANMPYDLGNVYTGSKQYHFNAPQFPSGMGMGQNFAPPPLQYIPPSSTTRY